MIVLLFLLPVSATLNDYCGTSELPTTNSNVSADVVWVFFRHGSRTDYQETRCFPKGEQTKFSCSLQTGFFLKTSGFVKSYLNECAIGQLLDYSEIQMNRISIFLIIRYTDFLSSNLFLRSTDVARTLSSLDLLVRDRLSLESPLVVHVEEFDSDSLDLRTPHCERAKQLYSDFKFSKIYTELMNSEEYLSCSKKWENEMKTKFNIMESGDCLLTAKCASGSKIPITPTDSLSLCVETLMSKLRIIRYSTPEGKEFCQLAIFPFMNKLGKQTSLLATHDDTLTCLLVAWEIWDEIWPKYASFIVVERHGDTFSVLRDGILIKEGLETVVPFTDEVSWARRCIQNDEVFVVAM